MKLPTREEYFNKKALNFEEESESPNKELYICPVCGKGVKRDYSIMFMSNPPKYKYMCSNRQCEFKEII